MKKILVSLVLAALSLTGYSSTRPVSSHTSLPIKSTEVYLPVGNTGQLISVYDLSEISVKDFQKLTGKKMKLADKISFKLAQRQLKSNINDDGTFSSKKFDKYFESQSHAKVLGISWAGLALGLFLSLIGVLIAYLLKSDNSASMIKWAWIGAIISLIVWGAVLI
jgi:hypothetical protein